MHSINILIVSLLLCSFLCCGQCDEKPYLARQQTQFKDQVFGGNYTLCEYIDTYDTIGCAAQCGVEIKCVAFSFNKLEQKCRLYQIPIFSPKDAVPAVGWRFYLFGSPKCPSNFGFVHSRESQLCFQMMETKMTREQGEHVCHAKGADLIRLPAQSNQENMEILMRPTVFKDITIWLKLSLLHTSTPAFWSWGPERLGWSNWMPGDPNCRPGDECDCAVAVGSNAFTWGDRSCNESNYVLCEYRF